MGKKKLNISFEPDFKNVDAARISIRNRCRQVFNKDEAEALIEDFCLAATEAMNNAVEHSGAKVIEVELLLNNKHALLRVITEGAKFDPTSKTALPGFDKAGELPEGGFGLGIIHGLVDRTNYEYVNGKNVFTLEKRLK